MKQYILLSLMHLMFLPVASFALEDHNNTDSQIPNKEANNQQAYFYYYKGNKKYLKLNPNYIFVSGTEINSIQTTKLNVHINIKNVSEVKEDLTSQTLPKPNNFKEKHPFRYWSEIELTKKYSEKDYFTQIEKLKSNTNLIVAPYFEDKNGDKIGLSNYFYVKLKKETDSVVLSKQIEKHKVELVGYNKFMPLWFTLSVSPESPNALQMANLFYETGLFQYAEPDLMVDIRLNSAENSSNNSFTPNDTFYPDQWHLNNTGQNGGFTGIDINAEAAWDITLGNNVTIAVVDQGFDMNHPDLVNNTIGTGYDTKTATTPSIVWGNHGTPCAGLIGAEGNNNEGIIGVAPNSSLISVSQPFGGINVLQELANGINWAWENGAYVISNSWSGGIPIALMDDAIDNALTNGRGGLGTIVVFSAGNDNINGAAYPGNSNPLILCAGAIDRCGVRSGRIDKVPASCDPWPPTSRAGSNYGAPLDVVAGGTNTLTTDRLGGNGYNNYADLNYSNFDGTSAACPIVAGVAALVLSVNPNLTVQEVNDIIEQSAQKVRTDLYAYQNVGGRPNGTWNNEMGYGLVDAYQAVLLA